ncbi:hypothetical protein CesoFtcFv8_021554 [Champsocephalus esox]|uniref:Uncharacterized protein n=1 Tax=Champsocephalus esox TaxID=159716 RepID=A0AAN8GIR7_9TELE|nr:hypothetical protein CesoFtcFv8_021554 [Champsocephalus esox]
MSLSAGPGLYSQLSAVMEAVVLSAVAGLQKLVSGGPELLIRLELHAGQEAPDPDSARNQSREKMVQFASLMETLGNEALGKILNIVEEAELKGEENRSETSFIHILNHEENEHSYGVRLQSNDFNTQVRPWCVH